MDSLATITAIPSRNGYSYMSQKSILILTFIRDKVLIIMINEFVKSMYKILLLLTLPIL